jgi:hypothetical protein
MKITIKATLIGSTSPKDVVVATWDGRNWSGDAAFTLSSTEQQIIDEQWAWRYLSEALDDKNEYGDFDIADSGTWRWAIEQIEGEPFAPPPAAPQPGLSAGELARADAHTQLLQSVASKCADVRKDEAHFRAAVHRELPAMKFSKSDWAALLRYREQILGA